MALISIKRNVDLQPGLSAPAVFNCSQSDKGTTIMLGLMNGGNDYTVPSNITITIRGSRSNGAVFTPVSATSSGSTVSFTLTEEMTDTAGPTLCEAVLEQGNNVLGTANFIINVEASPMGADVPPVFTDAAWTWMLGKLTTETVPALGDDVISSIQGKVDKSQGSTNAKKFLRVNTSGNVSLVSTDKTLLVADQIADAKETGDQIRALDAEIDGVATTLGGSISTLNGITTGLQSSKLNKNQGTSNAGKVLMVNQDGTVSPAAVDLSGKANESTIAPEFSDQNNYTAGSYVYKNGVLYRFTQSHSGAWTGTDAETVTVGGELEASGKIISDIEVPYDTVNNSYVKRNGDFEDYSGWNRTGYVNISGCTDLKANISTSYSAFYASDKSFISAYSIVTDAIITIPRNAVYIVISATASNFANLVISAKKEVDIADVVERKVDKAQGAENAGKVLGINENGEVEPVVARVEVDPTLSTSGKAADAKVTGDEITGIKIGNFAKLDNYMCVFGSISTNNGSTNSDGTHKNVCSSSFFRVRDYKGIKKISSDAYRMDVYFYTTDYYTGFVSDKTQANIDQYLFSDSEKALYFKIQFRSNTDDTLNTSTRYGYLLTEQGTKVSQKNIDKLNAIVTAKGNGQSNFSLLVLTDIHGDGVRMLNAIDYLNTMKYIDAGACLGDISAGTFASNCDFYSNAVLNSEKDFFTVIGNHDAGNATNISTNGTQQQIFDKFILPVVSKTGTETTKSYYYKDYATYNLRLIILNTSDVPDTLASESAFLVSRGILGAFSQTQIDWFISTLANTPANYHVLILMHYVNARMTKDTNIKFQSSNASASGAENEAYIGIINDIVSAWTTGGSIEQSYTATVANMPTINVDADFTSRGTGVLVGMLAGHMHRDIIGKFDNYPTQLVCVFSIASMSRGSEDDLIRVEWEKSEDLLTVVSVDTTQRKLYLIRVGANLSKDFVAREDSCISY